jgi:hypothetical protein
MNRQPDKIFISRWIKRHGKLEFKLKQDSGLFDVLVKNMREGQVIDFMVDFSSDDGLLSQIAKLKAGTRQIAKESGHSFIDIEHQIKKSAGLYNELNETYKSFAHCSREELGNAIQILIEIGEQLNLNLR